MQTINCKVKSVGVSETSDGCRYRVQFDTPFLGFKKVNDEYVEMEVNYINFVPQVLIAQVLNTVVGADAFYTYKKETYMKSKDKEGVFDFGAAHIHVILRGADIVLNRTRFAAGDEYTESDGTVSVHEYDGYNADIVEVTITPSAEEKLAQFETDLFK